MTATNRHVLPVDASLFTRMRLAMVSFAKVNRDPADPYYGPLLNLCFDAGTYARLAKRLRETHEGRELLDARPTLQGKDLDLEALARLPEGTLGREFVRYFRDNRIEPFATEFPIRTDVDYLNKRYRETHDLFHLVTDYGTDVIGEMELQAFVLGNLGLRHTILVILATTALHYERVTRPGVRTYVRRLNDAYVRGRASRELLGVAFDELWSHPVAHVAGLIEPRAAGRRSSP